MAGERGRLTIGFNKKEYYEQPDSPTPYDMEGCVDPATGDLIIFKKETDNSFTKLNPTAALRTLIQNLDSSGVFDNAEAFIMNRKIYRMFFDQLRQTVRIDPELRFDSLYRYYAIREIQTDINGGFVYLTGVSELDELGNVIIISNLVDMNIIPSDSGDGSYVSEPQTGGLIGTMVDGKDYIVEFFDSSRILVNRLSFQAIAVRATDLDLSPDMAIVDMMVTTNRAVDGVENACFLYRGESTSALEIMVFLKYADGRIRDITYEQVEGGRLTITGVESLVSDEVTPPGTPIENLQHFTVTYQMIRTNASLPDTQQTTPSGSLLDPASLTISKDISVMIEEDVYADIDKVIVAGYVTEPIPGTRLINIKYFGLYTSGAIHDITNIVQYVSAPPITGDSGIGINQNITIRVPYGNAGLYKNFNFTLLAPIGQKYCIIDSHDYRILYHNPSDNNSGSASGRFTGFAIGTTPISATDLQTLFSLMTYTVNGTVHTPNYIRIRGIENPTYQYLNTAYVNNLASAYYILTSGDIMFTDKPFLVEFLEVTFDGEIAVDVFSTGALVHYARLSS